MDVLDLIREKSFLGQEFLTWLWSRSEDDQSPRLENAQPVGIIIGDQMVLAPPEGMEGARVTVKGAQPAQAEAIEALRSGKLVDSLRLGLEMGGEEFWLTIKAADLGISGLKLPSAGKDDYEPGSASGLDRDAAALERIALVGQVIEAIEGLFEFFLSQRLSGEAGGEAAESMQTWLREE